jgi:uncharacterized protein (TIGR02271 family)
VISNIDLNTLAGKTVLGADEQKIGKVVDVYESAAGPEATFVTVATGMFGSNSFVPLHEATMRGEELVVPYDKDLVKEAPRVEADEELTSPEEERLYRHYQVRGAATTDQPVDAVGHDTSGPTTDDAMTRSEEHLNVGTEQVEAGRARLRKRVVTEQVSQTVPVSHDEVTIEREPITDGNVGDALDGPAISEEEHEVVLTEERPVVQKEAVPVERLRLGKETVTEQAEVSEQVRKEQVELDDQSPR